MHYERYLLPGDEKPSWNCLSGKILNGAGLIPLFYFDKWCARKKWNFRGKKNTGNSNPPAFSGQHELFTALTHKLHHSYNLKNKIWSIVNSFSRNLNLNSVTPTWMDFCKTSFSGTFFCWEILLQDGCRNFLDGLQVNIFWCIECQEVLKGKHVKELRPQDLGPSKTFDKIWKAAKKVNRQE